ncbi:MAG: peroxidase family protein [Myxococcota bacterium]
MQDQFRRLRDGDRYWFEADPQLSREELRLVRKTKLSDIIRRNLCAQVQDNVFFY